MILYQIFFVVVSLNPSTIFSFPVTGIIKLYIMKIYYEIAGFKIRLYYSRKSLNQ